MLDDYWNIYVHHTFLQQFYECHFGFNKKVIFIINGASIVVTAVSLTFLTSGKNLFFYSLMVLIMQVVTSLRDAWDISKKVWTLRYYLPEHRELLLKMGRDWRLIERGGIYEDAFLEKINYYETKFSELSVKYLEDFDFSERKQFIEKADKKASSVFGYRHSIKEGSHDQETK